MHSFAIAPAGLRPMWLLLPIGLLLFGLMLVFGLSLLGAQRARFELSADGLRLRGDLYGRFIGTEDLRAEAARRVDLAHERALSPRLRTLGTGLPGYRAGWFRLENGEKALLYLTDDRRAVYIPTLQGYSLLLSPADPDAFLAELRKLSMPE